jgi:hypothetical protein
MVLYCIIGFRIGNDEQTLLFDHPSPIRITRAYPIALFGDKSHSVNLTP